MTNYLELLYLISFTGVLAVAYSYVLSGQIISSSPGNNRMQEIAEGLLQLFLAFLSCQDLRQLSDLKVNNYKLQREYQ